MELASVPIPQALATVALGDIGDPAIDRGEVADLLRRGGCCHGEGGHQGQDKSAHGTNPLLRCAEYMIRSGKITAPS